MVDPERAKEKLGKSKKKKKSKKRKKKRKKKKRKEKAEKKSKEKKKKKKAGTESGATESKDESSGSGSGGRSRSGVSKKDYENCIRAIANTYLYAQGKMIGHEENENPRRHSVAEDMHDGMADIISKFEIQRATEEYGIDWEKDVVEKELRREGKDSLVEKGGVDPSKAQSGVVSTEHYEQAINCLAQLIIFSQSTHQKSKNEWGAPKKIRSMTEDIASESVEFAGLYSVPESAQKYGIDFADRIGVVE